MADAADGERMRGGATRREMLGGSVAVLGASLSGGATGARWERADQADADFDAVSAAFDNPPREAGLGAYWYWLGGAMTREGVTADLEAMHANGITTAMLFAIGASGKSPLVTPPANALTPTWWGLVQFSVEEAARLGMTVSLNMCDGWATASGPWITPDISMQVVTWADARVKGGEAAGKLPVPPHFKDYYRDTAVYAMPWPEAFDAGSATLAPKVETNLPLKDGVAAAAMLDPRNDREIFDTVQAGHIDVRFDAPFTLRSVTVRTPSPKGFASGVYRAANSLEVLASEDGRTFRPVGRLEYPKHGWQTDMTMLTHALPETTARVFRFVHHPEQPGAYREDYDFGEDVRLRLFSLELSSRPEIHQIVGKSAAQWAIARRTTSRDVPVAACVDPAKMIDVSDRLRADGTLDWTAPAGRWRVLRLGYTSNGKENSAAGGAQGLEVDRFNRAAVKLQFDKWFGAALDRMGPKLAGRVLDTVHVDSWEASGQNWSPQFLAQFARLRGYDLKPWLPVMAGVPVKSAEESEAVLHDVRQTVAELTQSEFFETVAGLAHARGCKFSGEPASPTYAVDGLRWADATDVPMGEFWLRTPRNDKPTDVADAVSGGHIYGKRVIATESFTQGLMAWDEHPGILKPVGDRHYCRGINRFMLHVYAGQPFLDRAPAMTLNGIGTFFSRTQTWWEPGKAWFDYLRRCQAVLQQGRAVADIAVFIGEEIPSRAVIPERLDRAIPDGLRYDSINKDALLRLAKVEDGAIVLPGGARYRMLMLPVGARYSSGFLAGLLRLIEQGAVVVGPKPVGPVGREPDIARFDQLVAQIWGSAKMARAGESVAEAAARIGLEDDLRGEGAAIDWTHRAGKGWDAYFIVNSGAEAATARLSLRGRHAVVEAWNPDRGSRETLGWRPAGNRIEGMLSLAANESVMLFCKAGRDKKAAAERRGAVTALRTLDGPWSLRFNGFAAPKDELSLPAPGYWSDQAVPAVRYHAGSGHYRTTLAVEPRDRAGGRRLWLDLGTVREMAQVIVNGKTMGTLWTAPFRIDVTDALKVGANSVEIVVTNTWHNRFVGDHALAEKDRVAWVSPRLRKGEEWLPAADAPLIPSGLAGPVRLMGQSA